MVRNWLYQNNRNSNKFLEVRRYSDGHYVWKLYIKGINYLGEEIKNYTGCVLKNVHKGIWRRVSKETMIEVIEDYKLEEAR